jgi:hypothetical protein
MTSVRARVSLYALAPAVGVLLLSAVAARAGEPARPGGLLFHLTVAPEPREVAFDRTLREAGPEVREAPAAEILPDGSVRYGQGRSAVTVTVKNPCPPETAHFGPPPLPGRRVRE